MLDAPVSAASGAISATLVDYDRRQTAAVERQCRFFRLSARTSSTSVMPAPVRLQKRPIRWSSARPSRLSPRPWSSPRKPESIQRKSGRRCLAALRNQKSSKRTTKVLDRNFKPGFRIRLHEKDMKIALATGSEYGVPLMVTGAVGQMMDAMKGMGNGDLDHSALVKFCRELAKKELGG